MTSDFSLTRMHGECIQTLTTPVSFRQSGLLFSNLAVGVLGFATRLYDPLFKAKSMREVPYLLLALKDCLLRPTCAVKGEAVAKLCIHTIAICSRVLPAKS